MASAFEKAGTWPATFRPLACASAIIAGTQSGFMLL
jgi:hypothetical protein